MTAFHTSLSKTPCYSFVTLLSRGLSFPDFPSIYHSIIVVFHEHVFHFICPIQFFFRFSLIVFHIYLVSFVHSFLTLSVPSEFSIFFSAFQKLWFFSHSLWEYCPLCSCPITCHTTYKTLYLWFSGFKIIVWFFFF